MTPQKTGPWTVVVACGLALALTHARVGAQEAQIQAPDGAKVRLTMGKQTTAPLEVRALFVDLDALKRLSRVLDELDDITDHAAGWKCPDIDVNQMRRIMQAVAQTEVLLQRTGWRPRKVATSAASIIAIWRASWRATKEPLLGCSVSMRGRTSSRMSAS